MSTRTHGVTSWRTLTRGRPAEPPGAPREPAIDGVRGLAVLLMVLGNFELGVAWVPAWLKHTPDVGYTIADLIAPTFIVVSAFAIGPALERRRTRAGAAGALGWLARRSLELIGIGAIISAGQAALKPIPGTDMSWGVLQSIGGASLLLATVVLGPGWIRVLAGVLVLALYQGILGGSWGTTVLHTVQGGLPGTMGWGGLMILASVVADGWRAADGATRVAVPTASGLVAIGAGLLLSGRFPISKNQVSATYILLSLGLALLAFAIADVWFSRRPMSAMWLQRIGRHPLQLYAAHLLLLAPLTLSGDALWYAGAPPGVTLVEAALLGVVIVALAALLDRRGWALHL